jgi:DNA-binding transcriptional MerR regulator
MNNRSKIPILIKPKAAAQILGRPESTLRYWRCLGVGPPWVKLEGRVFYDEAELLQYIQRSRRNPSVRANMEEHDGSL